MSQQPAPALTATERQLLTIALDLVFDRMVSEDGFTEEDFAAHTRLRLLVANAEE